MKLDPPRAQQDQSPELHLAGHLSLAFINTVSLQQGQEVDLFQSDQDVVGWLRRASLPTGEARKATSGALLRGARSLRAILRESITRRKADRPLDPALLNAFLAKTSSHVQVVETARRRYSLSRVWPSPKPEQLLAPVAESAAALLAENDFALVKRCESEECIVWFLDETKSHQRRWCSMATCGNRAKAASFRARLKSYSQ